MRPNEGLDLIKPSVRAQAAYSLIAPTARRKLNQNESPTDVSPALKRRILGAMERLPWHRYPAFAPRELHEQIARHNGWTAEGVLTGNGSNELIQATLAVAIEAGDRVVAPTPTFALYRLLTAVLGGRYVPVPLGTDFAYDVDALVDTARRERAKVLVINSPNNPTGSALPAGAVERLLAETDALILCDEAYQEFGGPSAIPLLDASSRLVVLRTFSKAMGLAGLRFGYALANPAVAREIAKGKLPYNVNALTLTAASIVLEERGEMDRRVAGIVAERERCLARLRTLPGLAAYDSAANFFIVRCLAVPAPEVFRRLHSEFGILVRDVSGYPELAGCLRVSVGTAEDMDAVVEALGTIMGGGR